MNCIVFIVCVVGVSVFSIVSAVDSADACMQSFVFSQECVIHLSVLFAPSVLTATEYLTAVLPTTKQCDITTHCTV